MKSGIYKIRNIINNKIYIGSAVDILSRWLLHKHMLNKNNHHSILLQRSWNKYGEQNFTFRIIEKVKNKSNLIKREQYWLDKKVSYIPKFGYNVCKKAGSMLGFKHSLKSRKKSSKSHKGQISWCRGKKFSKSHCKKLSQARLKAIKEGLITWNKGKKFPKLTKRHKDRMSIALKGRKVSKETREKIRIKRLGFKHSLEDRENMRKAHLGQKAWNKGLTKETNFIIYKATKKMSKTKLGMKYKDKKRLS